MIEGMDFAYHVKKRHPLTSFENDHHLILRRFSRNLRISLFSSNFHNYVSLRATQNWGRRVWSICVVHFNILFSGPLVICSPSISVSLCVCVSSETENVVNSQILNSMVQIQPSHLLWGAYKDVSSVCFICICIVLRLTVWVLSLCFRSEQFLCLKKGCTDKDDGEEWEHKQPVLYTLCCTHTVKAQCLQWCGCVCLFSIRRWNMRRRRW